MTVIQSLYVQKSERLTDVFWHQFRKVQMGTLFYNFVFRTRYIICRVLNVRQETRYGLNSMMPLFENFPCLRLEIYGEGSKASIHLYFVSVFLLGWPLKNHNVQQSDLWVNMQKPPDICFVVLAYFLNTTVSKVHRTIAKLRYLKDEKLPESRNISIDTVLQWRPHNGLDTGSANREQHRSILRTTNQSRFDRKTWKQILISQKPRN